MRRNLALILALIAAAPVGLLGIGSLVHSVPKFFDPCLQWGSVQQRVVSNSSYAKGNLSSALVREPGPCTQRISATTETKAEALMRLILVSGGLDAAGTLGILGALGSLPLLTVSGAVILFLESLALIFSFAPLTIASAMLLLIAAWKIHLENGIDLSPRDNRP